MREIGGGGEREQGIEVAKFVTESVHIDTNVYLLAYLSAVSESDTQAFRPEKIKFLMPINVA